MWLDEAEKEVTEHQRQLIKTMMFAHRYGMCIHDGTSDTVIVLYTPPNYKLLLL